MACTDPTGRLQHQHRRHSPPLNLVSRTAARQRQLCTVLTLCNQPPLCTRWACALPAGGTRMRNLGRCRARIGAWAGVEFTRAALRGSDRAWALVQRYKIGAPVHFPPHWRPSGAKGFITPSRASVGSACDYKCDISRRLWPRAGTRARLPAAASGGGARPPARLPAAGSPAACCPPRASTLAIPPAGVQAGVPRARAAAAAQQPEWRWQRRTPLSRSGGIARRSLRS